MKTTIKSKSKRKTQTHTHSISNQRESVWNNKRNLFCNIQKLNESLGNYLEYINTFISKCFPTFLSAAPQKIHSIGLLSSLFVFTSLHPIQGKLNHTQPFRFCAIFCVCICSHFSFYFKRERKNTRLIAWWAKLKPIECEMKNEGNTTP